MPWLSCSRCALPSLLCLCCVRVAFSVTRRARGEGGGRCGDSSRASTRDVTHRVNLIMECAFRIQCIAHAIGCRLFELPCPFMLPSLLRCSTPGAIKPTSARRTDTDTDTRMCLCSVLFWAVTGIDVPVRGRPGHHLVRAGFGPFLTPFPLSTPGHERRVTHV